MRRLRNRLGGTGHGEWSFALNLAQKNGIPFISGEPLELEADSLILSSGKHTWEDLLGFYILRQLPQHFRLDIPQKSIEQVIANDLLYLRKSKNLKIDFGYPEFSKWYTLRFTSPKLIQIPELHFYPNP